MSSTEFGAAPTGVAEEGTRPPGLSTNTGNGRPLTHGTEHGYRREMNAGETPCAACSAARDKKNLARSVTDKAKRAALGAKPRSEASRAVTGAGLSGRRAS
jgi:hypothetical protein